MIDLLSPPEQFKNKQEGVPYGTLTERTYHSQTTDSDRLCWVYTPPNYDPSLRYPVLYLLHGIGGTHDEWLHGHPNEIISNLIHEGTIQPLIAVLPNVRANRNDEVPDDIFTHEHFFMFDNFINDLREDLIPFVEANYLVSSKREEVAIAGLSMGGRETLYIITQMADVFGAAGAFSPAPGLLPTEVHNQPGQVTKETLTLPEAFKNNTFVLICTGEQDQLVNYNPMQYCEALQQNGVPVTFYTIPGNHDFTVWSDGLYRFVSHVFKK